MICECPSCVLFQPKKECACGPFRHDCEKRSKPDPVPPTSEVDEKIDEIVMNWSKQDNLIKQLRELVELVREERKV